VRDGYITYQFCQNYIIVIIIKNECDLGGTVALLLQYHRTMLPWSVSGLFHNVYSSRPITQEKITVKTGKFQVTTGTKRLMKQLGLAAVETERDILEIFIYIHSCKRYSYSCL